MSIADYLSTATNHLSKLKKTKTPCFYLDTSVPDALFQTKDQLIVKYNQIRQAATTEFWTRLENGTYIACTSEVYFREVEEVSEPKKSALIDIVSKLPKITISAEIERISKIYVSKVPLPKKKTNDALHLATATVNGIDAVVTWNFEDMLKCKTINKIRKINKALNLKEDILIVTPLEVLRAYKNE